MQHIAIAEDRLAGIQGVIDCLTQSGAFAIDIMSGNGYELLSQLQHVASIPDLIFTDINMPVMDGVATNFYLSHHFPSLKIISISAYYDDAIIQQVFEAGAHGYLVKPDAETVVLTAIETVLSGGKFMDPRINADKKEVFFNHSAYGKSDPFRQFNLTPRETTFVILNATTLTWEQIAKLMFVELKTVQTYYDRIAKKLGVNSRQALTLFSLQNGLAKNARYSAAPLL